MNHFQEYFRMLKSKLFFSSIESEEKKAQKVIWYSFFISIGMIVCLSYVIFVVVTFSGESVKVSNVEGDNIYTALKKLSDKELGVRVYPKYSDEYLEGIVFNQNPSAGASVKKNKNIAINVSMGKKSDALPDFVGMNLFEIAGILNKEYGSNGKPPYVFDHKIYEFHETVDKGHVFKQEPAEGTPIKSVRTVKLWISNGLDIERPRFVGNYIGRNLNDVLKELEILEVNTNIYFTAVNKKNHHFMITEQNLQEGTDIEESLQAGSVLTLTVNLFIESRSDFIKKMFIVELPKKNLPYQFCIYKTMSGEEKELYFSMKTKGGFIFSIPYAAKKFSHLLAEIDDTLLREEIVE